MGFVKIRNFSLKELTELLVAAGYPKFRARQVFEWQNKRLVQSFDEMLNLPKELREDLKKRFVLRTLTEKKQLHSSDGTTVKFLHELCDGNLIESVVMKYKHGYSVCVSTQVGCKMGCAFCASGANGFVRNLEPAEILEQVIAAQKAVGQRVGHVVLMGIGEPLDNFENVVKFIYLVSSEEGLNIGQRNISISTSGLVAQILNLAELRLACTLSISLHAPNDSVRSQLMPVNNRWGLGELMQACRVYFEKTKRRISFEYVMIEGLNDDILQAKELAGLLEGMPVHVNLIPVNSGATSRFKPSEPGRVAKFRAELERLGVNATVRRRLGADINAACGQLRQQEIGKKAVIS